MSRCDEPSGISERWMRRAIELTEHCPRRPFASVIVDPVQDAVVAEGWNRSGENSMWHGEIDALNRLAETGCDSPRESLVLYTTAEPCAMCQGAILWTRLGTVVYGTSITSLSEMGWGQIAIPAAEVCRRTDFHTCALIGGMLEESCDRLFQRAISR